jgi:hypothetical protein
MNLYREDIKWLSWLCQLPFLLMSAIHMPLNLRFTLPLWAKLVWRSCWDIDQFMYDLPKYSQLQKFYRNYCDIMETLSRDIVLSKKFMRKLQVKVWCHSYRCHCSPYLAPSGATSPSFCVYSLLPSWLHTWKV